MIDLISLLTPQHDVLLVRRDPGQEAINGLFIPNSSQLGKAQTGVVEKAGPGGKYYEGKRIIFGLHAGIQPQMGGGGQEIVILRPSDVVGLVGPKESEKPVLYSHKFCCDEDGTCWIEERAPVDIGDIIPHPAGDGVFVVQGIESWYGLKKCSVSRIVPANGEL